MPALPSTPHPPTTPPEVDWPPSTYGTLDGILPLVTLPSPCLIRVTVGPRDVCLYVGPRDWRWDRATGELIGAGTALDGSRHETDIPSPDSIPLPSP